MTIGLITLFSLVFAGGSAFATVPVDDNLTFELEGNSLQDTAADDWENVNDGNDSSLVTTGIVEDFFVPTNQDRIFTGGGSKDDLDIPDWLNKQAKPTPDKDNILNAGAAAYSVMDDTQIFFFLDRFANNGAADVGFWFFQNEVTDAGAPTGGPSTRHFTGTHANGDLLILSTFSKGGDFSEISVYEWCSGCGNDGNVNLLLLSTTGTEFEECDSAVSPKGDVACAIANAGEVTVGGWSFDPKFGTVGKHPKNSFFEGGVNLNEVFEDVPCFTGFLAETRSSPSVDATLKDYALGEFELCSATGIKDCDQMVQNSTFDGFEATLSGSVTNTGVGPLWQAIVRCDNGTTDPADDFDISVANKIEPDGIPVLWGPLTESSDFPFGTYGGTVFAATFDGGPLVDFGATEPTSAGPPATNFCEAELDAMLQCSKECAATLKVDSGRVSVQIDVDGTVCVPDPADCTAADTPWLCCTGNLTGCEFATRVEDITVRNDRDNNGTFESNVGTIAGLNPGDCAPYSDSYFPATITDITGEGVGECTDGADASWRDNVKAFGTAPLSPTDPVESNTCTIACGICPEL